MVKLLVLSVGGVLGTLARYFLSDAVCRHAGGRFPYGTLVVNAAGCFLIGFLGSISQAKAYFGPQMRLFFMVGFCGAFTTFSTYILETNGLFQGGHIRTALMNIIGGVLVGFFMLKVGMVLGELC